MYSVGPVWQGSVLFIDIPIYTAVSFDSVKDIWREHRQSTYLLEGCPSFHDLAIPLLAHLRQRLKVSFCDRSSSVVLLSTIYLKDISPLN